MMIRKSFTAGMLFFMLFSVSFSLVTNQIVPTAENIDANVVKSLDKLATNQQLLDAVNFGEDVIEKSKRMENAIAGSRVKLTKGSISHALLIDGYPTPSTRRQDNIARTVLKATSHFVNSVCKPRRISSYDCGLYLAKIRIPESSLLQKCKKIVEDKKFNDEYRRLLPAKYQDGIYEFRKSSTGVELPHPRSISAKFHGAFTQSKQDSRHSVALVQWTQFIEHDVSKTTVQSMHDGTNIECCTSDLNSVVPRYLHPACKPLNVDENDSYYSSHHVTCLNYVRSALSLGTACKMGPANQLNHATNRLDLSQLYGNYEEDTKPLRTNRGGKLKSQSFDSSEYLIESMDKKLCVANSTTDTVCYASGDSRVNVNPYITLLHTLFLRSHNRLAKHLALVNPHWTDEQLFIVARNVNIKIYHMIVRDWLQAVLGSPVRLDRTGVPESRVSNEFATAAIRFYNTMMPGEISHPVSSGQHSSLDLVELFYKPKDLRKKEYFAHLLGSVLEQHAMSLDTSYVDDMAQLLFKTHNVGTDVLALDIQRGRDHGLSSYTSYFALCNGKSITTWNELSTVISPADLEKLRSAYASVDDIDLIIGAIAENPTNPDALVGPTFECIIKEQLSQSLAMDATHNDHQIDKLLSHYSAARFLCDTAQLDQVQQNIFRLPSTTGNPVVRCAQLPGLDFSIFREKAH